MKLPIIVPRWSRVTLGMPRGPETRATMPYGLLVDLHRPARAGGPRLPRVTGGEGGTAISRLLKTLRNYVF